MKIAIDLTAWREELEQILSAAKTSEGIEEVSEPVALDASEALNAGITLDTVEHALSFITVVFTTGKAALEFLKAVRQQIKSRDVAVAVAEPTSGKVLGYITADSADESLEKMIIS
jgi:hypothetical protein